MSRALEKMKFEDKLVEMVLAMDRQRQEAIVVGGTALTAANYTETPIQSSPEPISECNSEAESE